MDIRQPVRPGFLDDHTRVAFVGSVGLGKAHPAVTLGRTACEAGHEVLFVSAVAMNNGVVAAQAADGLRKRLRKHAGVELLILDEVGYLPIDKTGADLMLQVLAARHETDSTILTTSRADKHWLEIFSHDATLTAALLDCLVHRVCAVVIEGGSCRNRD